MELLERSLVRIFHEQSHAVIGAGFLISKKHVLTCTHVVKSSLRTGTSDTLSAAKVQIQFPFLPNTPVITAEVVLVSSVSVDNGDDLAVLEVMQELPKDAHAARLVDVEKGYVQEFKAYGFPDGYPNGIWASGLLRGKVANGRVQIEDVRQTGYFIEPGFSGTAVWNDMLGGVLGIVVSADTDRATRVAFMIPTDRIRKIIGATLPEFQSVYHPPAPKKETLLSNLLTVQSFAPCIYVAVATKKNPQKVIEVLREQDIDSNEWLLKGGNIVTFHNLEERHWAEVCDQGSIEEFDTEEWAYSTDEDRQRDFVFLLNKCLEAMVKDDLRYDRGSDYYYFRAPKKLKPRVFSYQAGKQKTERQVFAPYNYKTGENEGKPYYYRHSAFSGHFRRYDDLWYLEITPTYHFTSNGYDLHPKYEDFIKKIKQLERNQAVIGQVRMWAYYLTPAPNLLIPQYPLLSFGNLLSLEANFGLNDDEWLSHEEDKRTADQPVDDTPLF